MGQVQYAGTVGNAVVQMTDAGDVFLVVCPWGNDLFGNFI